MGIYNNEQLYICAEAHRCDMKQCDHKIPHMHMGDECGTYCSPYRSTLSSINKTYRIPCIPIPNEVFIDEKEFEI